VLQDDEIIFRNIISGAEERKFKPGNVRNSFALSPDGNTIAVSQKATGEELKNISTVRNDKKAMKEAEKFREVVVFYDAMTFAKKFVADDIFDIVFSMKFSEDGNSLYLFNAPNRKLRTTPGGATRNGYIQIVNPADGKVSRVIYSTNASEPIYKESNDTKYFATTSIEQRFRVLNSVLVFNRETGETVNNFVNDFRLTENTHIGRSSFEFLPDHKTIVLGYGYYLALWNFEK
jgi:WD40 repeat protein